MMLYQCLYSQLIVSVSTYHFLSGEQVASQHWQAHRGAVVIQGDTAMIAVMIMR